ncbi:MAG: polyprenol monophosphomannose synthase [Candidatus Coatesbacteria bacterium]|nr:polyprenol monophosphomannose synthase [Candidatus Coatesbacteria bacterium]
MIAIVVPTYNERANIELLYNKIKSIIPDDFIFLVVDDNSMDGTREFLEELGQKNNRVRLLSRPKKAGLGSAYRDGFSQILKENPDYIVQMDADLSHDPEKIPEMLAEIEKGVDLVIGSRYITGINVINWPMSRLLLSWTANHYARIITGLRPVIHDVTGGFKIFKREVLQSFDFARMKSDGYSFQIEMNFMVWKKGFKIKEIPIIFIDRHSGTSKMSKRIVWEALWMVWRLRFKSIFGRIK